MDPPWEGRARPTQVAQSVDPTRSVPHAIGRRGYHHGRSIQSRCLKPTRVLVSRPSFLETIHESYQVREWMVCKPAECKQNIFYQLSPAYDINWKFLEKHMTSGWWLLPFQHSETILCNLHHRKLRMETKTWICLRHLGRKKTTFQNYGLYSGKIKITLNKSRKTVV